MDDLISSRSTITSRKWGWVIASGILYLGLGLIAYTAPTENPIALSYALAALLVAAGFVGGVEALQLFNQVGGGVRAIEAMIPLIAGIALWSFPNGGILGIGLTLTVTLLLNSVCRLLLSMELRVHRGWEAELASSATALILGVLALRMDLLTALWVPAALLATDFLIEGIERLLFAWAAVEHIKPYRSGVRSH